MPNRIKIYYWNIILVLSEGNCSFTRHSHVEKNTTRLLVKRKLVKSNALKRVLTQMIALNRLLFIVLMI